MKWTVVGALYGLLGVGAGAFGAHGLREQLTERMLGVFEIGVRYQMYHALVLVVLGLFARRLAVRGAGWCFAVGTLLFSGSLYGLALTGAKALGPVTPIGGTILIVGWGLLAKSAWAQRATLTSDEAAT